MDNRVYGTIRSALFSWVAFQKRTTDLVAWRHSPLLPSLPEATPNSLLAYQLSRFDATNSAGVTDSNMFTPASSHEAIRESIGERHAVTGRAATKLMRTLTVYVIPCLPTYSNP